MPPHLTAQRLLVPLAVVLTVGCADPTSPTETTTTAAASPKSAHGAPIRLAFPGDYPGGPFYSELAPDFVFHTDQEAAILFWRQPDCVPGDFNLLDFLDLTPAFPGGPPRPFLCTLTVHGVDTWHDPATDPFPFQEQVQGSGAVPVWFVSWPELEAAIDDGVLTIAELSSLPSLRIGHASFYRESIRNLNQGDRHAGSTTNAHGALTDGSPFRLHVSEQLQNGERIYLQVLIEISGG
jgi:hypothetical protein